MAIYVKILKDERACRYWRGDALLFGQQGNGKGMPGHGLFISFAGPVTFDNAKRAKEVASYVPVDRLLTETDCPYLTPVPLRGRRNYPGNVKFVVEEICRIKNLERERLLETVVDNTIKLFGIDITR
jgi:Tat protein secretion system quality control protein TatD with DNase activity